MVVLKGTLFKAFSTAQGVQLLIEPDDKRDKKRLIINLDVSKEYLEDIADNLLYSWEKELVLDLSDANCLIMELAYYKGRIEETARSHAVSFAQVSDAKESQDNLPSKACAVPFRSVTHSSQFIGM